MRFLVDMDDVIANFEKRLLDTYKQTYPDKPFVEISERREFFFIEEQYPKDCKDLVIGIYEAPGFFRSLEPIEGAIDALQYMAKDHEVFICTSPLLTNPTCVQDKYDWVNHSLGEKWTRKVIITNDKTIVNGDYLIDDKGHIKGAQRPLWEHMVFDRPYNRHIASKRRLTWDNYRAVLNI